MAKIVMPSEQAVHSATIPNAPIVVNPRNFILAYFVTAGAAAVSNWPEGGQRIPHPSGVV